MTAAVAALASAGRTFALRGDSLVIRKSDTPLTDQTLALLKQAKPGLMGLARQLARVAFVDFETRSPADLSQVGIRNYLREPRFEVLLMVACLPDGKLVRWQPGEPEPVSLFDAVRGGAAVVAHNAHGFDRLV